MTLEILNPTPPAIRRRASTPIGDLYEAVHCWLFARWVGRYEEEEKLQESFDAFFRLLNVDYDYAKISLKVSAEQESLKSLDPNMWTGGSWLTSIKPEVNNEEINVSDFAAAR